MSPSAGFSFGFGDKSGGCGGSSGGGRTGGLLSSGIGANVQPTASVDFRAAFGRREQELKALENPEVEAVEDKIVQ